LGLWPLGETSVDDGKGELSGMSGQLLAISYWSLHGIANS
jgi:hypothetical protein